MGLREEILELERNCLEERRSLSLKQLIDYTISEEDIINRFL